MYQFILLLAVAVWIYMAYNTHMNAKQNPPDHSSASARSHSPCNKKHILRARSHSP